MQQTSHRRFTGEKHKVVAACGWEEEQQRLAEGEGFYGIFWSMCTELLERYSTVMFRPIHRVMGTDI